MIIQFLAARTNKHSSTEQMIIESSPIPVKWALEQMDKIGPGIRLPLVSLSKASEEPLLAVMKSAGVID